jgi:hypothetical protein
MTEFTQPGFSGDNPLGFLGALGLLRVIDAFHPDWGARLYWQQQGTWRAVLQLDKSLDEAAFTGAVFHALNERRSLFAGIAKKLDPNLKDARDQMRAVLQLSTDPAELEFLSACAAELPRSDEGKVAPTPLRMVNGAGHQDYLPIINEIASALTEQQLRATLFGPWRFEDEGRNRSLRWDPADRREYALRWDDPSGNPATVQLGANRLAIEALPLFPVHPGPSRIRVPCFFFQQVERRRRTLFRWPLWNARRSTIGQSTARGYAMLEVKTLLALPYLGAPDEHRLALRSLGVAVVYESQRLQPGYFGNFSPPVAIPI